MTDATAALEVACSAGCARCAAPASLLRDPAAAPAVLLTRLALRRRPCRPVDTLLEALWGEQLPADPSDALPWAAHFGGVRRRRHRRAGHGLPAPTSTRCRSTSRACTRTPPPGPRCSGSATTRPRRRRPRRRSTLWRGEPLSNARELDFAQAWIAQLEDTQVALTQLRLASQLELGRPDAAVAELQGLTRRFPDREELWRLLMLGLYRAGRQADALEAFRNARLASTRRPASSRPRRSRPAHRDPQPGSRRSTRTRRRRRRPPPACARGAPCRPRRPSWSGARTTSPPSPSGCAAGPAS